MYILTYIAQTCDNAEPLVTGNNPIPDAYMTASSSYRPASTARLHYQSAVWRPTDAEQNAPVPTCYFQVSFDTIMRLLMIKNNIVHVARSHFLRLLFLAKVMGSPVPPNCYVSD